MMTLRATQFDWDGKKRTMSADISDLQWPHFYESFLIDSDKMASKIMFAATETIKDNDGDVQAVVYKPVHTLSSVSDIRLTVFND